MSKINFRPWIGKNYLTSGFRGKRILVLGESHYCDWQLEGGKCFPICSKEKMFEQCFSQTVDAIGDYVSSYGGNPYEQTFLCFERAFLGKEASQEEREDFWQGIIFYNYLQFAQDGARRNIKPEYWAESELAFKPDCIIVWGVRLYNGLPDWGGEHTLLHISQDDYTDVWTYSINDKKIPALKVYHPSTPIGKSWTYWHEVYNKFWEKYDLVK